MEDRRTADKQHGDRELDVLRRDIKACRICLEDPLRVPLPHEPNPVCTLSSTARICIAGQAPGIRVHRSGKPFTDPSGDRLRQWMGVDESVFYDQSRVAIVPMGFCFPGYDKKGGDLPPRRECRNAWHDTVYAAMPQIELVLVIGQYAQAYHLGNRVAKSLTATVARWRDFQSEQEDRTIFPMPHPSWRNNGWLRKNPWFEAELLPVLRKKISELV